MAQADVQPDSAAPSPPSPADQLQGQTYEIIRKRLAAGGEKLRERLAQLNDARKDVFGSIETALLGTERVTTENNCIPRDMVAVGEQFLFGYNVHIGLRSETKLSDVFAVYRFDGQSFHEQPLDLIADGQFERDFQELYKYYKHTTFAKFAPRGPHLFMVFRVGKGIHDIKTFKWAFEGGRLVYLDNRSDHEFRFPPQHEFEWKRTTREMHRAGVHPHISIEDRVFVEAVGGDLTIKIENNTDSGEGVYAEDVENKDQILDDADVQYAIVGNLILLKILPYQEKRYRYFVYNEKIKQARRLDSLADACLLLPDDHGLIFPNGYYLQSGECKTFETNVAETVFSKRIIAPNGEDYLYIFYNRATGTYVLLSYNLISQEVSTPLIYNGMAAFEDGKMLTFRHHDEPQKHHAVQIWQTPFVGQNYVPETQTDSVLFRIGNRDLVRAMAECYAVLNLLNKDDTYGDLYLDIVRATTDVVDSYFWIDKDEAFNLKEVLVDIRDTAAGAINEFEKVVRVRKNTREEIARVSGEVKQVLSSILAERFDDIGGFVRSLANLRRVRGEIISLGDLRYADHEAIEKLEAQVREQADSLSRRCVDFLLEPNSLKPYERKVAAEHAKIEHLEKVADAKAVEEQVAQAADELEMLIEIVSNLKIDDATQRTEIIDNISAIFSRLNQARAALKNKTQELMAQEGAAEFHSQLKLLDQSVVNYLDICDSPDRCEELLTKVMIQIEEMEGRFAEFDEFIEQLAEKRDEIYNAFESRRLALIEARNRRANTLMKSAERILKGVKTRVESFESVDEINGYFASDLMIEKVRDIVGQLQELDDSVKVDDIQSRVKTIKEDAVRQLKDRQELYVDGQNIIQLGRHQFSVNVQALDLTTVFRDGRLCYHLTGTNFFEPIEDEPLLATRAAWDQEVVSENDEIYRAEYLAYLILQSLDRDDTPDLEAFSRQSDEELLAYVQKFMSPRYSEGYVKGVHDQDAAKILRALCDLKLHLGPLRFGSQARSLAWLFWRHWSDATKPLLSARLKGFGMVRELFPETQTQEQCIGQLRRLVRQFVETTDVDFGTASGLDEASTSNDEQVALIGEASEYLFHALAEATEFAISREASDLYHELHKHLELKHHADEFARSLDAVRSDVISAFSLARDWVRAYLDEIEDNDRAEYADETALVLLEGEFDESRVIHTPATRDLEGMVGTHAIVQGGRCHLHFNRFIKRLAQFEQVAVPRFLTYTHRKRDLVDAMREDLRLEEFRPRVLTSFVRNKLIDKVYLPLVGDNLAKQIGAAGEGKRTDRMGLLLVISPPGYGKTTLMEYIANRLGVIFMKINGPAIGHRVTSLDPQEAPNASAREEVEKLNLSLEMGDNVMIYLDDIQHCHPELLQKFISLCDAQRKIEGVYKGRTRTYDLRGRKVCVVMAGNPYTESGEKFQIPDMLANRADTYNLGEIIGDNRDVFEMSYLENSLTANPTLANLAGKNFKDVYAVMKMAETGDEAVDLEGNYSLDELGEYVAVMKKMMHVRDVLLSVNREYIRSAAQSDDYRTEPPFKLQGSYRNMNRIAERISPIMNDRELQTVIYSAYENDAQTLTTGAEANLLKFKELTGTLDEKEAARWEEIKKRFRENVRLRGIGADDKFGQVIAQMGVFSDGLSAIEETLSSGVSTLAAGRDGDGLAQFAEHLGEFRAGLESLRLALTQGVQQLSSNGPKKSEVTFSPETTETLSTLLREMKSAAGSELDEAEKPIHIVNKVPRVILGVIREQFKLMESWLKPLAESSTSQNRELRELRQRLEETLGQYQALIGEVDG